MFAVSDQILQCSTMLGIDRKWKSNNVQEHAPNCPRCASANTKFCYYNNYSLSQPRYFCKGCRRYWTEGGSLRNVPVGGGCRKSRRGKSSRVVEKSTGNQSSMFNYRKNILDGTFGSTSSSNEDSGTISGSDIDLAVVFANYLNQGTTQDSLNEGIDHVCSSSLEQDNNYGPNDSGVECQKLPLEVLPSIPGSNYVLQELPQVKQQIIIEENSGVHPELLETDDHMKAFGLQNLLGAGEMVQLDALWPSDDDAATTTSMFEWQPMAQMQQFESFPADDDDQLKVSANLMAENWSSSFDLPSGFGLFQEP